MTKFFRLLLVMLCIAGFMPASAAFKDIKIDLTNGNLLTADEITNNKKSVTFGVAIADDGTATRVAADDASANIVLSGTYHSNEHGWGNFSAKVAVEGPVKVSMGTCNWGGDVTVKDEGGNTVATFNTNNGKCYHNDKVNNIASALYKGTEATTLTISGGSYTPYIAVEAVNTADVPSDVNITYSLGEATAEGILPAGGKAEVGSVYTIPGNFTLYAEGKTLTGWSDGTKTYKQGETFTVSESDITLTAVFTDNTVSLADRTESVTLKWDFQRQNGAPIVGFQNATGIWVTQATIGGKTIDVKIDFDTNNGGKIANANWNDWAQMNGGTKFTIPSCKGAVVSMEAFSAPTTTTIDGQTDYTTSGTTISYTIANTADNIDIVIGDGDYYRYIQTVLPVIAQGGGGITFTNEPATIMWGLSDGTTNVTTATPKDGLSITALDLGENVIIPLDESGNPKTATGQAKDENGIAVVMTQFQPKNGANDTFTANVKPVKGLTFTPSKFTCYIGRVATDAENGVTVNAIANGKTIKLGNYTAPRTNRSQADDKFGGSSNYTNQIVINLTDDQKAQLKTTETFSISLTVGVGNTKTAVFGQLTIEGTLDGTAEQVNKYTLALASNPEDGGSVSAYPAVDEYTENDEVTLTATENFGYDFVNWTNAAGEEVSKEPKFKYTVTANETLTANFKAVNTYSLDITVEGGANDYMISLTPAPTVVEGKNMYEEGTKVTISASSNPIIKFTNWSNGETVSEMPVTMNENKSFVANYTAVDYIVGWDFIKAGGSGRPADFAATDNDAVNLVLRDDEGNESGWLDKSQYAAGGYEGRPAAVNWRTGSANGDIGHYYWQTCVNAAAFTDLKIITSMAYNYNAYTTQLVEYSLDGINWTTVGKINLSGAKKWTDATFNMPADVNNKEKVYIRWISDKTSSIDGAASANDGIALGGSYIIGTAKLIDDGTAPALVSSVPAEGATGASANGKVVLNFNEKIKLTSSARAAIGDTELVPTVSGKTVMCEYKGLDYSTDYTFTLYAGSVSDLTDNVITSDIVINFQTKVKPAVTKALYDFIVPTDGTITEALAAANKRGSNATERFRIFITNGNYIFDTNGTTTGGDGNTYPDPRSYLSSPYVSFIGESTNGVVITNITPDATWNTKYGMQCPLEGIGNGDVLIIQKEAHDTYFQNLTMKSSMGDAHGRDIVLQDKSNRTIFKDACLWGYQDTYVSNNQNGKFYFEGGVLRGRTDYLCGKGDVFYNDVTLQQCGGGGYLAVPSQPKNYGYVFSGCYIKKETSDVTFYLGRPWGSGTPTACFINTKMDANAIGNGWADMSGGWPKRFAEYNSYLTSGTTIDLSGRRTSWTDGEGVKHSNDPILTLEDVQSMSLANVMGQDDDWDPTALTEQASAPAGVVLYTDTKKLSWSDNNYVLCWAVFKNGKFVAATTDTSYDVDDASATWSVRAANEMGGLGEATVAEVTTNITEVKSAAEVKNVDFYNLQGVKVGKSYKGTVIRVQTLEDGSKTVTKMNK